MQKENENRNTTLASPLAGGARRTGKSEGEKENTLLNPLIGLYGLRPSNHFPRGAARRVGSHTTNGFTLIELLVVVLIIGILAAVALPKYEMAVEKAHATKAIMAVKNLSESMERYYLANGKYPSYSGFNDSLFWEELDMEMPAITGFDLFTSSSIYVGAQRIGSSRFNYYISRDLAQGGENKKFKCWTMVLNDTSRSAQFCKQLCGGAELKKAWGGTPSTGCEF